MKRTYKDRKMFSQNMSHEGIRQRRDRALAWILASAISVVTFSYFLMKLSSGTPVVERMKSDHPTIPAQTTSKSRSKVSTSVDSATSLASSVVIDVPVQSQFPQLKNGCEVTSLSMLLTAVGHPIDKITLAKDQPKDPTKLVLGSDGVVKYWGNPNVGFVGSVYDYGYGIYHGPMTKFINQLMPGTAVDLTGRPFSDLLAEVAKGHPVIVWTTATFRPTDMWQTWKSPEGTVRATMEEHTVLLVGYNRNELFVNNSLNGQRAQPVNKSEFIKAWRQLGEQAVTILRPVRGKTSAQISFGRAP